MFEKKSLNRPRWEGEIKRVVSFRGNTKGGLALLPCGLERLQNQTMHFGLALNFMCKEEAKDLFSSFVSLSVR